MHDVIGPIYALHFHIPWRRWDLEIFQGTPDGPPIAMQ
jgi:hypothetical protein